jgi:serine/threonine protein kinase
MFRIEGVEFEKSEDEIMVEIEEEEMMSRAGDREPRRVIKTESVNQSGHSSGGNSEVPGKPGTPKTSGKEKSKGNDYIFSAESFFVFKQTKVTLDYTIGKKLGEGSYGEVRLVIHKNSGLSRAMKSIKKQNLPKEEQSSLINEVNLLKSTDHPNIIKIFDLYEDKSNYYIITEYCSGGELYDRIKKLHTFSEKQAAMLMKQILSSVNYLHSNGIVHRDLKAENILFESADSNSGIKVIDFGISRKIKEGQIFTERMGLPSTSLQRSSPRATTKSATSGLAGLFYIFCFADTLLSTVPTIRRSSRPYPRASSSSTVQSLVTAADDWSDISNEAKELIRKC